MKGRKVDIFQGGVNVPFIVRWPGRVNAGAIDSTSVLSAVDLLPTFAELAGEELPDDYQPDGESFTTIFDNNPFERRKPLFWDWRFPVENSKRADGWVNAAVRYGDWKVLADSTRNRIELYNIKKDRFECQNLVVSNTEKANELLAMWDEWKLQLPE
jgi:N-acetylgalactosamine-6-sulfatase